jgi:hypothetical protein
MTLTSRNSTLHVEPMRVLEGNFLNEDEPILRLLRKEHPILKDLLPAWNDIRSLYLKRARHEELLKSLIDKPNDKNIEEIIAQYNRIAKEFNIMASEHGLYIDSSIEGYIRKENDAYEYRFKVHLNNIGKLIHEYKRICREITPGIHALLFYPE